MGTKTSISNSPKTRKEKPRGSLYEVKDFVLSPACTWTATVRMVALCVADATNSSGRWHLSLAQIMTQTGVSRGGVQRAILTLTRLACA